MDKRHDDGGKASTASMWVTVLTLAFILNWIIFKTIMGFLSQHFASL